MELRLVGTSMGPFIGNGDIVVIEERPPCSLRVGDIIMFQANNCIFVHRIVRKWVRGGKFHFRTKGDALPTMDSVIRESNIIGKVIGLRKGTMVLNLEQSKWRFINYLFVVGSFIRAHFSNFIWRLQNFY